MLRNVVILALSGLAAALSFNGTGQLRTLSSTDLGSDLGCLTDTGLWSKNETLCGTFTGVRSIDSTSTVISSSVGPCTLNGTLKSFECSTDTDALTFWAWSGLITDWDVLAYGETVTFSSAENATKAPAEVRKYRTTDPKPWIWLGWLSL
ncbi:hypothetical protein BJ170DRAFT_716068 [Xylariales sp. AK1849]|nr:hypothetical protein BJ170DRAFT_716068 [Xylariales sp. AK1849]